MIDPKTAWLFRATNDLDAANDLFQMGYHALDVIIYHTQQCAEKALKGFLAFHRQEILKTHDLEKLVNLCIVIDPAFWELRKYAVCLTPNATEFRYCDDEESVNDVTELLPDKEDVQTAIEFATAILEFVKQKIENIPA